MADFETRKVKFAVMASDNVSNLAFFHQQLDKVPEINVAHDYLHAVVLSFERSLICEAKRT